MDHHGVKRFVIEQLAVVVESDSARGSFFQAGLEIRLIDVANGAHIHSELLELAGKITSTAARADDSGPNAVVGASNPRLRGCRR